MSNEEQFPEELAELERALASFEPSPTRIDRDRLMFEAGAAACSFARTSSDQEKSPELSACETNRRGSTARDVPDEHGLPPQAVSPRRWALKPRLWPVAAAAATMLACIFAGLFTIERNRPPVVVRDVIYLEQETATPELVVGAQPTTDIRSPAADRQPVYTNKPPVVRRGLPLLPDFGFLTSDPSSNYLALRQFILARGVDALPQPEYDVDPSPLTRSQTAAELLREFLPCSAREVLTNDHGTRRPEATTTDVGDTI